MISPNFFPFPELHTDRLLLRQLTFEDAPGVMKLRSNTEVMKYINRPLTLSLEDSEKWIRIVMDTVEKNEGITWCMCLKDSPVEHIGNIGIWRIDKDNHRGEVGYMLDPSLQGKGYMLEALQKVVEYGFNEMKLHTVEAQINPDNIASAALLKKAGFVQEAYFKENSFFEGRYTDTAVYSKIGGS